MDVRTRDMADRLDLRLEPTRTAPAEARRSLERVVGDDDREALETCQLLVSELVTNSVRHAGLEADAWIGLRVEADDRAIRVAVSDPGQGFDQPTGAPAAGSASGWGLYLVEQMADRWGVEQGPDTLVWFELDRPPGS